MLGNFIYSKTKNLFLLELEAGNVLDEAIVFIEDTKLIWNHGIYFDGKNIDLTNYETVEESVLKLLEAKTYTDEQIKLYHSETLTINFITGTNWVSFYVQTTLEELQTALGTNGITITTSYDGGTTLITSTYDSETNTWSGDLTELDFTKMYQIECSVDCSITLSGKKVGNIEITLNPGWNWIGYPSNVEVKLEDALRNLTPNEGDIIRNKTNSFAEYYGSKWLDGGVNMTMEPTSGYQYYNSSSETKTFTYPTKEEMLESKISSKLDKLVSGTNIKTVNGTSILGSGDITIESGQIQSDWNETDTTSKSYIANKPDIYVNERHCIVVDDVEMPNTIGLISTNGVGQIGIEIGINNITWHGNGESGHTTYTITSNGDGTKFLSNDGTYKSISTSYPQVNHGTSDATFALTSNVLHIWDEVTELSLTLADPTDTTVANEYLFQFTSGATATTLTLPDTIKWLETPSIESDKIYQISILNNCGTILGFV